MDKEKAQAAIYKRLKEAFYNIPSTTLPNPIQSVVESVKNHIATDLGKLEDEIWDLISQKTVIEGKPVTCRECGERFHVVELFRCFRCKSYFCSECAKNHTCAKLKLKGAA